MAIFLFARAIVEGKPIKLFNYGKMSRDFTYIDDVCRTVTKLVDLVPTGDPAAGIPPAKVYNVGNSHAEELMRVVELLEQELGLKAALEMLPIQPGDVTETFADVGELSKDAGFSPSTSIEDGIAGFVAWYRNYYKV